MNCHCLYLALKQAWYGRDQSLRSKTITLDKLKPVLTSITQGIFLPNMWRIKKYKCIYGRTIKTDNI